MSFPFFASPTVLIHFQDPELTLLESEMPAVDTGAAEHGDGPQGGPDMSKCASFKPFGIWLVYMHGLQSYGKYSSYMSQRFLNLRLRFPTVAANTSPVSVLPQYVDVLGRKLDKCQTEMDRYCCFFYVMCIWVTVFIFHGRTDLELWMGTLLRCVLDPTTH